MVAPVEKMDSLRKTPAPRRAQNWRPHDASRLTPEPRSAAPRFSEEIKAVARVRRQGRLGQMRAAASLALKHRQAIKEGDLSAFIPAFAFAIAKDGFLDFVPIVGNILGLFITIYLFIFLFGRGKWRVRLVLMILSFIEVIPAVNLIPFQTICVFYVYHQAKKDVDMAKTALASLNKAMSH